MDSVLNRGRFDAERTASFIGAVRYQRLGL